MTWSHTSWELLWQFLVGLEMYAIVKNTGTIMFIPYNPAIFTSKRTNIYDDDTNYNNGAYRMGP